MIKIQKVNKTFYTAEGPNHALKEVSLQIEDGQCVIIGGENGSGKSVLMSILAGLEDSDSGEVQLTDSEGKTCRAGLVFQEAETQILGETPREDIAFGPKNLGLSQEEIKIKVENALNTTGLSAKADFPARFLSGGEKRRLAIACMISMDFPVIILDEPYANLDFVGVKHVNNLILRLKKEGKTIIVLSHEIEKCLGFADKFVVLFRGEKVFDGTPEEGLQQNLEQWNIRNPVASYSSVKDMVWL